MAGNLSSTILPWATCLTALLCSSAVSQESENEAAGSSSLKAAFEELHRSYERSLFEVRQAPIEAYMKQLADWKRRATDAGFKSLAKEIDQEIAQWKATQKEENEALENRLKDVPPLLLPSELQVSPGIIEADFSLAQLSGGPVHAPDRRTLENWSGLQSKARLDLALKEGTTYTLTLDYATPGPRRIKIEVGDTTFAPTLTPSETGEKVVTLTLGDLEGGDKPLTPVVISLLPDASRAEFRLHGLRAMPLKETSVSEPR